MKKKQLQTTIGKWPCPLKGALAILFTLLNLMMLSQSNFRLYGYAGTGAGTGKLNYSICNDSLPYTVLFDGGSAFNLNAISSGSHTLQITSAIGNIYKVALNYDPAIGVASTFLALPPLTNTFTAFVNRKTNSSNSVCDGAFSLALNGNAPPFNNYWYAAGTILDETNTPVYDSLCSGNIGWSAFDNTSCPLSGAGIFVGTYTNTTYANFHEMMGTPIITAQNVACFGSATGAIGINNFTDDGVLIYNATVIPGGLLSGLTAGIYTIQATDSTGTTISVPITISQPSFPLSLSFTVTNATAPNYNNGSVLISASGGVPAYNYELQPIGQGGPLFGGLSVGNYTAIVTDAYGCVSVNTVAVVTNSTCSTSAVSYSTFVNSNGCVGDTTDQISVFAQYFVNGVQDNSGTANLSATVEWGDGQFQTHNLIWINGFYTFSNGAYVKHLYSTPGTYPCKIKLQGAICNDSIVNQITITSCQTSTCSSAIFISTQSSVGGIGVCVNDLTGAYIFGNYYVNGVPDNSGTANLSYIVEWGDGSDSIGILPWYSGSYYFKNTPHHFSQPGTYTWKIKLLGATCNDSIIGSVTINACGNLIGTVYYDANNNCNQNSGEIGIANIPVTATLGGNVYMAWTDNLGNYAFGNIPAGNYLIQIDGVSSGYTTTCGNSLPHITNVSTTGTTVENFALYFDPASCNDFDIAVASWPTGMGVHGTFFPGDQAIITPVIGVNNAACTQTITGKVKIVLDPCLTYTGPGYISSVNGGPDYVVSAPSGDTLLWNVANINNIGGYHYWDYSAAVSTCTNAQVGDSVCITTIISPTSGDANPSNNMFTHCFAVGVSYDPNFKEVTPKGIGAQGNIPQNTNELTYTLHFQNTGTATAHNIYLLDTISTALDLESIEIVASSHPMHPYLLPNRTMKFMFANIMLADSTHDEAHSHGYVTYRIKPNASLPFGTQIKNTGHIYFDYNEPVATNTTLNTIAIPTSIKDLRTNGLVSIYPNPAKDKLTVSIANNENSVITITDILGKEVMQQKASGLQTELNISDLSSGVYFVKVNNQTQKVIISK